MALRMPTKPHRMVRVVPHSINNPTYEVTLIQAERMIARGSATWIVESRSIREQRYTPRGERRDWRKRDSGGFKVMQLVLPVPTTSWAARLASSEV
jgi:hypothetical protein